MWGKEKEVMFFNSGMLPYYAREPPRLIAMFSRSLRPFTGVLLQNYESQKDSSQAVGQEKVVKEYEIF